MKTTETFEPGQVRERIITDYLRVEPFLPGVIDSVEIVNKFGRAIKATVVVEDGWCRITLEDTGP